MKSIETIKNNEELKEVTNTYVHLERELEKQETLMNKELDEIKRKYDVKNAPTKAQKEALKMVIQSYADDHKEELITNDKRSYELPLATIGYRKSTEVVVPNAKMASIIEALEDMGRMECIDIRKTVKKSTLSSWSQEALEKIGLSRKEKDTFYIEVKTECLQ
ncbi:Mu-like prophage host-nuclease inhibitor protein Gam [Brevinema andersonii]|uniref:Mu-like prophage host-nuclease inhibitor protein Gam n=1 Tax=Brevinema andersonii TaxID=34097 RepID=A0A1I1ET83_BREAD|nr:host-nuclease inhibitor Gam family protein [Brevinema andersonii]SFB88093.1 Mu-like prophage host-nuclease inhibitor protein Gam [Brevinema andersonii]